MVLLNSCHLALSTGRVRSGRGVVVSGGYCLEDGAATICTSTASLCELRAKLQGTVYLKAGTIGSTIGPEFRNGRHIHTVSNMSGAGMPQAPKMFHGVRRIPGSWG